MTAQLVSGVVIGVVVAVAGAFVSHWLIQRRERELWKREDMRKDNDELREACARFLAICDSSWNEVFSTGTFDEAAHRELRFRWIEMRLIAPEEVAWSATDLYFTVSGRTTAWTDPIPSAEYADRVESFLTAVRAELGKPPTRLSRPEDTLPDAVEGED